MRLQHEQVQRLGQAVTCTTTSDAGMLVTPPLLTGDSAAQLHNIAGQPPTPGAFCPNIVDAASLATAPTLQTASAGTLGTAGENSTPKSTPDVRLTGDHAAVSGRQCESPPALLDVPLPPGSDSEYMDTTTMRKRLCPSEPGRDDEGASRKLQASSGVVQGVHGNFTDDDLLANTSSDVPVVTAKRRGTTLKEGRLATIKASAPTHLSHREAQAVLRAARSSAGSTGSGPPQAVLAGGKTYAAALSTPATELRNPVNHPEAPWQQMGHLASGKKRGCAMPSPFQKKAPQSASNENTNLQFLLRVVADLPPPDNQQLRSICLQAEAQVADLLSGPVECCAIRVRLGASDTTVGSIYVSPGRPWNPASLMPLAQPLRNDFLLCGDVNANHTAWSSHDCYPRGQALWDVSNHVGLSILSTGTPTFMRRAARVVLSAINVSFATEGCHYTWTPLPDTWGSDHLPLQLNPIRGKTGRSRLCHTVDWKAFRKHCQKEADSATLLQLVADNAKMATIHSTAQVGQPVP
ncbi:hypothetical protein MTO96_031273 [Rhipicephalus appendiculatus]